MPLIILTLIIQVICIVHVVRTNRDKYWIGLILMVPGIGSAVYFITQILPNLGSSRTAGKAKEGAIKILDPSREFREARTALEQVDSIQNRMRLIDAAMALEKYDIAEHQLSACMTGYYEHDPHMLMRLAEIRLIQNKPEDTIDLLDRLQTHNENFRSQSGHMLYARALEQAGDLAAALESYEGLTAYAAGEEARTRYGMLLKRVGQDEDARRVFLEVRNRIKHGAKFYKKSERQWGQIAAQQLDEH